MDPFFSVIIPTFNQSESLVKALKSVLDQDFSDYEIVVVDDGGQEDTAQMIGKLHDNRIHFQKQENAGPAAARNVAVGLSKGKFLAFLDSDDVLSPNFLQVFHEALSPGGFDLGIGHVVYHRPTGETVQTVLPWKDEMTFAYPICGAFVMSRGLFLQLGGYDSQLRYSENTDLFLRIEEEKRLGTNRIVLLPDAGVRILAVDKKMRNRKYSKTKYKSLRYFLQKHKVFFDRSPNYFSLFGRIYANAAAENGDFGEARTMFMHIISKNPLSIKDYLRFFLVCLPPVARFYYH